MFFHRTFLFLLLLTINKEALFPQRRQCHPCHCPPLHSAAFASAAQPLPLQRGGGGDRDDDNINVNINNNAMISSTPPSPSGCGSSNCSE
jgi:hypothetical protein